MPEISKEVQSLRSENAKTFDLGKGKRRLEAHIGAIHYKDNYADPSEQWKDIDLTWEGNRITKAPYELTLEGKKLTLKDKKTGEVSTIELLESKPAGLNWEIIPRNGKVFFRHILPSNKIPFEAKFRVTGAPLISQVADATLYLQGKAPYFNARASDDEGELELETSFVDGILTEKLSQVKSKETGQVRPAKGNIRIDPTFTSGASSDDCLITWDGAQWSIILDTGVQDVGYPAAAYFKRGGGLRFLSVTIPQGATIDTAYLTVICGSSKSVTTVNSRITGEDVDDAATWSTVADYQARRGTVVGGANDDYITSAQVDWDAIPAWTAGSSYQSPSIVSIIQEIISRGGWASGQDLALFWDDHDDRSTHTNNCYRRPASWDNVTYDGPTLYVEYSTGPIEQAVGGGAVTPTGALGLKTKITTGEGAVTPTGALGTVLKFLKAVGSGAITPSGVLGLLIKITTGAGSITPSGALGLLIKITTGAGSITPAGALAAALTFFQNVGQGAITPVGALGRKIKLAVGSGSITPAGALNRIVKLVVGAGSITPAGALGRLIKITVGAGSITPAGALAAIKTFLQNVGQGAITPIGILGRKIKLIVGAGSITPAGALATIKKIFQNVGQGAITPTGALNRVIKIAVGAGSITPAGALAAIKTFFQNVGQGAITPAGVLTAIRKIFQNVGQGAITPAGALGLLTKITVGAGAVTPTGVLGFLFKVTVGGGAVAAVGTLGRKIKIAVGLGSITPTGALVALKRLRIWIALLLRDRSLTVQLNSRPLTVLLYDRSLTVQLNSRPLTVLLYDRSKTVLMKGD